MPGSAAPFRFWADAKVACTPGFNRPCYPAGPGEALAGVAPGVPVHGTLPGVPLLDGSRARGTHRPDSDADVAVLLRGEHRRLLPTALAMADVAYDVLLETGINIAPLPIWMDEWEHPETYSNPALLRNIAREGVRL